MYKPTHIMGGHLITNQRSFNKFSAKLKREKLDTQKRRDEIMQLVRKTDN